MSDNGFYDLIKLGYGLTHWVFDAEGQIIDSNSPTPVPMHGLLTTTDTYKYLMDYSKTERKPLLLSAPFGLLWCACFAYENDRLKEIHLLGPCFNTNVSLQSITSLSKLGHVPLSFRQGFIDLLSALPTVSSHSLRKIAIMLHCHLTEEELSEQDVLDQIVDSDCDIEDSRKKDRHETYMAERALLAAVRNGTENLYAVKQASHASNGIPLNGDNPTLQVQISVVVFTSLCTRAAIEGGLSPDHAYSLGDYYIQQVMACSRISSLSHISDEMYHSFINEVHKLNQNPKLSQPIQSCCDYIAMHPEEELSLSYLAKRSGYTEYYLSRKFKTETGHSINEYINIKRIDRAKILLETTDYDIQTISENLHFGARSYFAKVFRDIAGESPTEYRKRTRKK